MAPARRPFSGRIHRRRVPANAGAGRANEQVVSLFTDFHDGQWPEGDVQTVTIPYALLSVIGIFFNDENEFSIIHCYYA